MTTTPIHYGQAMEEARDKAGLTQEQVAAEMGVSQRTISAWEKGTREPNVTAFLRYMAIVKAPRRTITYVSPWKHGPGSRTARYLLLDLDMAA